MSWPRKRRVNFLQMLMTTSRRLRDHTSRAKRRPTRSLARRAGSKLLFVLFGLLLSTGVEAKTLKIATLMPEGSSFVYEIRQAGKNIERRTDGRVRLKL